MDLVSMTYIEVLPQLIQNYLVFPKKLKPMILMYPPNFNNNAIYKYHDRSPGHTTKNCKAFNYRVQELIDQKILSFANFPNIPRPDKCENCEKHFLKANGSDMISYPKSRSLWHFIICSFFLFTKCFICL